MESPGQDRSGQDEECLFEIDFFENLSRRDPKDVRVLEALAHLYTRTGRVSDGLRVDRRIVRHDPSNPVAHYNLACSLALRNRKKESVESLRNAIDRGYADVYWMLRDEDLEGLKGYAPFEQLVREVANQSGETGA